MADGAAVQMELGEEPLTDLCAADASSRAAADAAGGVRLCLAGHRLRRLAPCLAAVSGLCHLAAPCNHITTLRGMPPLPALRALDVSHNALPSLDGLPALPELRSLDASFNALERAAAVTAARKSAPRLAGVDLRGNPAERAHRSHALRRLPHLTRLDGADVTADERRAARCAGASMPAEDLSRCCCAAADDSGGGLLLPADPQGVPDLADARTVRLDGGHLRRLDALAALTALRWASVARNELTSLHGLHALPHLTRLDAAVRLCSSSFASDDGVGGAASTNAHAAACRTTSSRTPQRSRR